MDKLPELPPSDNVFWEHSERNVKVMEDRRRHEHVFKQIKSREIKCSCGMGLFIGVGDIIKEGHLYHNGKLII